MNELQQFCILAKTQKSRACAALIQQVISHRKIYVFGELLEQPSVQSLKDTEFAKSYNSLELFAYGTLRDYLDNPDMYLEFSEVQLTKLKHLTLVSLAAKDKAISYEIMQRELDISSVRALEDLIIDAMYAGLLSGKMDPAGGLFRIKSVMARDVKPGDIAALIDMLTIWRENMTTVGNNIKQGSATMNQRREVGEAEQKATAELVALRRKEIKDGMDSGEPVEDVYRALTGEDMHSTHRTGTGGSGNRIPHPMGGASSSGVRGEGYSGNKSRAPYQGYGPTAGKHPRHQQQGYLSSSVGRR